MRSIISKLVLAPVALAALVLATHTASAETIKVPFAFTAFGHSMPAGSYTVELNDSRNLVSIRNNETSKTFSWVTGPGAPDPTDKNVSLSFDTLGSTHVLRSIQYGSKITSRLDKGSDSLYASSRLSQGR